MWSASNGNPVVKGPNNGLLCWAMEGVDFWDNLGHPSRSFVEIHRHDRTTSQGQIFSLFILLNVGSSCPKNEKTIIHQKIQNLFQLFAGLLEAGLIEAGGKWSGLN